MLMVFSCTCTWCGLEKMEMGESKIIVTGSAVKRAGLMSWFRLIFESVQYPSLLNIGHPSVADRT